MKNKTQLVEKVANLITDLIHNDAPKDIIVDAVNLSMKLMDYKETKTDEIVCQLETEKKNTCICTLNVCDIIDELYFEGLDVCCDSKGNVYVKEIFNDVVRYAKIPLHYCEHTTVVDFKNTCYDILRENDWYLKNCEIKNRRHLLPHKDIYDSNKYELMKKWFNLNKKVTEYIGMQWYQTEHLHVNIQESKEYTEILKNRLTEQMKFRKSEKSPEGHFDWFEFKECFTFGDVVIVAEVIKYDTKHEMYYYHAVAGKDGIFDKRKTYLPVGYGIFDKRDLLEWIRWITWTDSFDLKYEPINDFPKIKEVCVAFKSNDPYCTFDIYTRGKEYITELFKLNKEVTLITPLFKRKGICNMLPTVHHNWGEEKENK